MEITLKSLDLQSDKCSIEVAIQDDDYNNRTFNLTPDQVDKLIVELNKLRLVMKGIEAARSIDAKAVDETHQSADKQEVEAKVKKSILMAEESNA